MAILMEFDEGRRGEREGEPASENAPTDGLPRVPTRLSARQANRYIGDGFKWLM